MSTTSMPQVYIVRIGKHIKIGFSRNVARRMKAFETSNADVELLHAFDGDIVLERRLHGLLAEARIKGEIFHQDWRIGAFIRQHQDGGLEQALKYLEDTTPDQRKKRKEEDRASRVAAARLSKAEKDAYFASLVAERKARLGR